LKIVVGLVAAVLQITSKAIPTMQMSAGARNLLVELLWSSLLVLALSIFLSEIAFAGAMTNGVPSSSDSAEIPNLGTADDYVNGSQDVAGCQSEIRLLGITVTDGTARLEEGQTVQGVRVCSLTDGNAAAKAGLRGQQVVLKELLKGGFLAAGMFFPPAMLGAVVISAVPIGESYDLIIAVDGQRTHNVAELLATLVQASAGELSYLVVVRGGRRIYTVVALR
jgi:S1-C subfamily serine protease